MIIEKIRNPHKLLFQNRTFRDRGLILLSNIMALLNYDSTIRSEKAYEDNVNYVITEAETLSDSYNKYFYENLFLLFKYFINNIYIYNVNKLIKRQVYNSHLV